MLFDGDSQLKYLRRYHDHCHPCRNQQHYRRRPLHRNRYLLKNIWKTNLRTKIQVKFDIPPLKPKGDETHVVSNKNATIAWRCGQYQWISNGSSIKLEGGHQLQRKYPKIKTTRKIVKEDKATASCYNILCSIYIFNIYHICFICSSCITK